MRFDDLKLSEAVLRAVHAEGYETPTPIQEKAIPNVLAGKDLLGCAQTGTGKTAAFALPILSRMGPQGTAERERASGSGARAHHHPRVLVLTPTRELAVQIAESFTTYGKFTGLRVGLIFGGVSQSGQERMLRAGVDILVATPGRLMDMMNQRLVNLSAIEVFVLDEADRMLDMGFIADIRKVIARLPAQRQNLLFSATMPAEIKRLADGILRHPVHVAVTPVSSTAERVKQVVYHVERRAKPALLLHLLNSDRDIQRVLIFTRTKHGADRLARGLEKYGVKAEAIHGNKSQNQRQRALETFKQGQSRVLVATDIAARGLDIEMVSHVINYELPNIAESYVHRIGRTGRAGESGVAISFCDPEEREFLRDIERVISNRIPVATLPVDVGAASTEFGHERNSDRRAQHGGGRGRGGSSGGGGGRPERRESRPQTSPSSRPAGPARPTHAPRSAERPVTPRRPDNGRPPGDQRPSTSARPVHPGVHENSSEYRGADPRPDQRRGPVGPRVGSGFAGSREPNRSGSNSPYRGNPRPVSGTSGGRPVSRDVLRSEPPRSPGPGRPQPRHRP